MAVITNKRLTSPIGQLIKNEADLVSFLKIGDLIEARLLKKAPRRIYFDLGKFGTGILYGSEFLNARNLVKDLELDSLISAKVADLDGEEGLVELSLAGAHKQKNWQELKEWRDSGEVLEVKVIGANSGGLVAEVNQIKAFLPVSLRKFVGQDLKVKILDFNPRTTKLILSEKEAVGENLKELVSKYAVGDVVDGVISGLADFGAFVRFVDTPAIEGLVHISEIDHRLIDSPKEVLKVDESVKVKIIDIKDGQVSLSIKALTPNPWDKAGEVFRAGEEIGGRLSKFNPFGAYISLDHDLHGLVHVSEFGGLEEMKKELEPGKEYRFIIESVKPEEKRIILKIKK
ncbi:S1 RNA-binding domain-containing protein [Candidatus Wolfebacteria bacterium]|nr:S1 RNA-binding domain-containing protein [Candidatus Wolfebacteria bacterium]